jgi:hypothetical protein
MLPRIRKYAQVAFHVDPSELREELVEETVANSFVAFARLVKVGKESVAFPGVLARFAIAQVRSGRRVGGHLRIRDVLSRHSQHHKGFAVERLDQFTDGVWQEILVEDKRATPADLAASRLDFAAWLRTLSGRQRKITDVLAAGETTSRTAKRFGITASRVSQIRAELQQLWEHFVADRID